MSPLTPAQSQEFILLLFPSNYIISHLGFFVKTQSFYRAPGFREKLQWSEEAALSTKKSAYENRPATPAARVAGGRLNLLRGRWKISL